MFDNTVTLHRVVKAAPPKVYRAFTDPVALASWIPPYGFTCTVESFDLRVGGKYRMSFTNFTTGKSHAWSGTYTELVPNEYIKNVETFDDPNLPGEMTTAVTLKAVSCGTELMITQEGIPSVIPVEMCYLGWQESLERLMKLVEPVIPDG
jgi:uncharacterized protein YndB with AHSA1/START domain